MMRQDGDQEVEVAWIPPVNAKCYLGFGGLVWANIHQILGLTWPYLNQQQALLGCIHGSRTGPSNEMTPELPWRLDQSFLCPLEVDDNVVVKECLEPGSADSEKSIQYVD